MMYRMLSLIFGYFRISVKGRSSERVLNRLMILNTDIFDIERINESEISFSVGVRHFKRVKYILDGMRGEGIKYNASLKGFPFLLYRYRKRAGIALGILLSCLLIWISGLFIWTIEIRGLNTITDEEMRKMLNDAGLFEGTIISGLDMDKVRFELITKYPQISYVTFFVSGTHALVSISERDFPPDTTKNTDPYNLVAKCDGLIVDSVVSDGMTVVKKGDYVKKGDLLVSGIVELQTTAYKTVHAKGHVYAETVHEFSVNIPFRSHEKVYTGKETVRRKLEILNFSIPLYFNADSGYEKYDAYKRTENLELFDVIRLPVRLTETSFAEYITPITYLTLDAAKNKAYDSYKNYVEKELSEREMIKEEIDIKDDENGVTLNAVVWCVEDIAEEKEFSVLVEG